MKIKKLGIEIKYNAQMDKTFMYLYYLICIRCVFNRLISLFLIFNTSIQIRCNTLELSNYFDICLHKYNLLLLNMLMRIISLEKVIWLQSIN